MTSKKVTKKKVVKKAAKKKVVKKKVAKRKAPKKPVKAVSLRNMCLSYAEVRAAMEEFFKTHKVCARCHGTGQIKHKATNTTYSSSPMKIDISNLKNTEEELDKAHNLSDIIKEAAYRQLGLIKVCPTCKGKKFVIKRSTDRDKRSVND